MVSTVSSRAWILCRCNGVTGVAAPRMHEMVNELVYTSKKRVAFTIFERHKRDYLSRRLG